MRSEADGCRCRCRTGEWGVLLSRAVKLRCSPPSQWSRSCGAADGHVVVVVVVRLLLLLLLSASEKKKKEKEAEEE